METVQINLFCKGLSLSRRPKFNLRKIVQIFLQVNKLHIINNEKCDSTNSKSTRLTKEL